jgi:hypothetical protein
MKKIKSTINYTSIILLIFLIISLTFNVYFIWNSLILDEAVSKPKMRGHDFHNAPPLTDTEGFQILVYEGAEGKSIDSEGFKLYINHNLEDNDGCELKGQIDPGYTCKLTFNTACYRGDVLVVKYYDQEVFRHIC